MAKKIENTSKKAVKMVAPKKLELAVAKKDVKKTDEVKSLEQLQNELVMKRMELRMGKLKDVRSISKTHDEIARIKTAARMKELTAE